MDKNLGVISVASPCSESWEAMTGDSTVRFCGRCSKNVYSLDTLSTDEVRELIVRKEGKLCWRFFVRKDGTVLTRDCPVGLRRVRLRASAAIAAVGALVLAVLAGALREGGLWNASQQLGSLSSRLGLSSVLPTPIRAALGIQEGDALGGMQVEPASPPEPREVKLRMLPTNSSY